MSKPIAPCKDCEKRCFRCFSTCNEYVTFARENEEYNKTIFEKKRHMYQSDSVSVARSDRANKALRRYKK